MSFTSGTQALQGRTVNHDPYPYRCTDSTHTTTHRLSFDGIKTQYAPRDGFAVRDNPILAEFRKIKNKYGTTAESAQWCLDNGYWHPESTLLGGPDVSHARRVLTLLAALGKEE